MQTHLLPFGSDTRQGSEQNLKTPTDSGDRTLFTCMLFVMHTSVTMVVKVKETNE